ncbi:unnamed protein product [Camellia sinensis]
MRFFALSDGGFEGTRVLFFASLLFFQGGGMDFSKVGEKLLSSVRSARSLSLLPSTSDRPEGKDNGREVVVVQCPRMDACGQEYQQKYSRGKPVTTLLCHELPDELKDRQGTHIKFWPDKEVFTTAIQFDYPTIAGRIREAQYAVLKEECHQLFPIVGSGRFITAPVITEDGDPIQDPIVLLEANPDKGLATVSQENATPCSSTMVKEVGKKTIQWKLTLHQIGWW